jgi:hypothetical protein
LTIIQNEKGNKLSSRNFRSEYKVGRRLAFFTSIDNVKIKEKELTNIIRESLNLPDKYQNPII